MSRKNIMLDLRVVGIMADKLTRVGMKSGKVTGVKSTSQSHQ